MDSDSDWIDILEFILDKCKYLTLADAMLSVRKDWNNGCDPVENAIGNFSIEATHDNEIYYNVNETIKRFHYDQDGRVFRDCEWNYGAIFTLVDPDLYKDYLTAINKKPKY
jgi:hypothetical protein